MKNKKECMSCKNIMDINVARCPLCNAKQLGANLIIVSQSGSGSSETHKYCFSCGGKIKKEAEMCPHCGVMQPNNNTTTQEIKSRSAAGLFSIFLGGLGIHKFYLGKIVTGIVYIMLSFVYVTAILALIDSMIIAYSSDATFNRMYNADNKYIITPCSGGVKILVTIIFIFSVFIILALISWIVIVLAFDSDEIFNVIFYYIDELIYNIF